MNVEKGPRPYHVAADHGNYWPGKYGPETGNIDNLSAAADEGRMVSNPIPGSEWQEPAIRLKPSGVSHLGNPIPSRAEVLRKPADGLHFDGTRLANVMLQRIADLKTDLAELVVAGKVYEDAIYFGTAEAEKLAHAELQKLINAHTVDTPHGDIAVLFKIADTPGPTDTMKFV